MSVHESNAAARQLEQHFATNGYGHASRIAAIVERLPSGEYAYVRPEDDAPRYRLTDLGRRALAMERLFGRQDDEP